ncbi:class I SAM-dependent methyltransferase [Phenylobacterium sp.]|uniref:class I SAM-dependent methyltransferase n=1 Tax=Phenylobacterium sp. TaxID=1871053 RepID=UPI00289C3612|nr:class I SAM-dependent methyltransferase [Phenylobacterium sp.]
MFTGAEALAYGAKIRARVPGYEAMHEMIAAALLAALPAQARLLVVGAGDGEDLLALARAAPGWRFVALDPEPDMIALARERAERAGIAARIGFHTGYTPDLGEAGFDAATAILVGHFLADDGGRSRFLTDIAAKLKPGGVLACADLMADLSPPGAYRAWLVAAGLDPVTLAKAEQRMAAEFHPVSERRLTDLLGEAGFTAPARLYQALGYAAYLSARPG